MNVGLEWVGWVGLGSWWLFFGCCEIKLHSKYAALGLGWIGAVALHPSLVAPKKRAHIAALATACHDGHCVPR